MTYTLEQLQQALEQAQITGDAEATSHVKKLIAEQQTGPTELDSFLSGAGQGITLDFLDEIQGFGGGLGTSWAGGDFGEGYTRRRDLERDEDIIAQGANPKSYLAGEFSSALLPGGAALKGAKMLPKALTKMKSKNPYAGGKAGEVATQATVRPAGQLAVAGGTAGGIAGLGASDEETLGGNLSDAGTGAVVGAIGAPLLGTALSKIGGGISGGATALSRKLFGDADEMSDNVIRQDLQDAGFDTAEQVYEEAQTRGGRLASVSPTVQSTAVASTLKPGPGRDYAKKIVEEDQAGQKGRLSLQIEETMGSPWSNFHDFKDQLAQRQKTKSGEAYGRAYDQEFESSDVLDELMTRPPMQKALENAQKKLTDFGPKQSGVNQLELYDQAKRELDTLIGQARKNDADMDLARRLGDLKREWTDELDELVPDYKNARSTYAGTAAMDNASEFGRNVLKDSKMFGDDLEWAIKDMGESEIEALRVGLVRGMLDILQGTPPSGNAANRLFRTQRHDDVIKQIYPDEQSMGILREGIENENVRSRLRNDVMGGSQTVERQQAIGRLEGDREISMYHNVLDFARRVYNREVNPDRLSTDDYAALAKKLFEETTLSDIKRIMGSAGRMRPTESLLDSSRAATTGTAISNIGAAESAGVDFE